MITIINYGLGNIQAISNIYRRLGIDVKIADTVDELADTQRIILPGVGAFDWAMKRLNQSGMRDRIEELVTTNGCPVLGICVGMQIMANRSDEGNAEGLGWIDGAVEMFDEHRFNNRTQLPHMGWNDVVPCYNNALFYGLEKGALFYFLHSYHFKPANAATELAKTDYGGSFVCGVQNKNIYGVQFHPEKSHQWGTQLLKNFAAL